MSVPTDITPAPNPEFDAHTFWFLHKSKVLLGLAILVAAILGYAIFKFSAQQKAEAASNALAQATTVEQLQKVSHDFSGTPAGGNALILAANKLRGEKKYDEAAALLKEFTQKYPNHELVAGAWYSLGGTLEAQGKTAEALDTYQLVATKYPKAYCAPTAMLAQGTLQLAAGKTDEARRIFENVLAQYPDSYAKFEAQRKLQSLPK